MEISRMCCIGCMPTYTNGDYVYFKNINDAPNEHSNNFILNQIPEFHITLLFKLCDDIFESLPKLFVAKMIKMNEITCPNYGSVIKSTLPAWT